MTSEPDDFFLLCGNFSYRAFIKCFVLLTTSEWSTVRFVNEIDVVGPSERWRSPRQMRVTLILIDHKGVGIRFTEIASDFFGFSKTSILALEPIQVRIQCVNWAGSSGGKATGLWSYQRTPNLVPILRTSGVLLPFFHIPLRHAQGKLCLYLGSVISRSGITV